MNSYSFYDWLGDSDSYDLVDLALEIEDALSNNSIDNLYDLKNDYCDYVINHLGVEEYLKYNVSLRDLVDRYHIEDIEVDVWSYLDKSLENDIFAYFSSKRLYFNLNEDVYIFKNVDSLSGYKHVVTEDGDSVMLKVRAHGWIGGNYGNFVNNNYSTKLRAEMMKIENNIYLNFLRNGVTVALDTKLYGRCDYEYNKSDMNYPINEFSFEFSECESGLHFFNNLLGLKDWIYVYKDELTYLEAKGF